MMMRTRPIVAIDGPVGAGKSTVARELARALGFDYLNTGAMYRAVAIAAHYIGIDDNATDCRLEKLLDAITISFAADRVLLDGKDITHEISQPAIGDLASRLSARPVVRSHLRDLQRAAGEKGGVVIEGRDIGTAIFPDAEFKFFLTADLAVRAARRFAELAERGGAVTEAEVVAQLQERDERDQQRELAPLRQANDAIVIDSSALNVNQVVRAILARMEHQAERTEGHNPSRPDAFPGLKRC
ncbi:MAG: (d)CMP kinase [Deltaproteobacteria bacterium]|nr:(d)CMP kinase [Deltaproteobacteria bacterium]